MERSSWIRKMFEEGERLRQEFGAERIYDFTLVNPDVEPPAADERLQSPSYITPLSACAVSRADDTYRSAIDAIGSAVVLVPTTIHSVLSKITAAPSDKHRTIYSATFAELEHAFSAVAVLRVDPKGLRSSPIRASGHPPRRRQTHQPGIPAPRRFAWRTG